MRLWPSPLPGARPGSAGLSAPNNTLFWRVALLRDRAEPYGFERPSRRLALQIQVVLGALSRNDSVGKQRSPSPGPKRRGPASPSEGRGVGTVRYSMPLPDEGEAGANATCRLVALATGEGVPSIESFRLRSVQPAIIAGLLNCPYSTIRFSMTLSMGQTGQAEPNCQARSHRKGSLDPVPGRVNLISGIVARASRLCLAGVPAILRAVRQSRHRRDALCN